MRFSAARCITSLGFIIKLSESEVISYSTFMGQRKPVTIRKHSDCKNKYFWATIESLILPISILIRHPGSETINKHCWTKKSM